MTNSGEQARAEDDRLPGDLNKSLAIDPAQAGKTADNATGYSAEPQRVSQRPAVREATAASGSSASDEAGPTQPSLPWFPIGGPTATAWREEMITKAQELAALTAWIDAQRDRNEPVGELRQVIVNQLATARTAAEGKDTQPTPTREPSATDGNDRQSNDKRLSRWLSVRASLGGAAFERTLGNLDGAETSLLRYAPDRFVLGQLPSIAAHVNRFLVKSDPRRVALADLAHAKRDQLTDVAREAIVGAFHAANTQRRRNLLRVRSFRNVVVAAFVLLSLLAATVGVLSYRHPQWLPLCFRPQGAQTVVCPQKEVQTAGRQGADAATPSSGTASALAGAASSDDVILIEFVGLLAATLAGAVAVRRLRGTTTPYGVPLALILLKLPTGALTAVLGLLFIRGGFVPGLTALDTSAQILAWAIVFGYSQQLFTRLVDDQAQGVLNDVGGHGAAGDRSGSTS